MEKILYAEISAIGLIILAFIYIKNRKSTISAGDGKIFSYLLIVLACILITDGAMWILDGAEFIFVHEVYEICATLFFGGTGILGYLWVIFCKSKLFPLKNL